ncbi:zinc finger-containing ubiquitin peptidase 1 [Scyliorhinus canicula]|uniref:zinc finger-containing ubiquitin peptidase 1 n=1 Tax=Scyliorhinus canicula TaxID=7830 RepID=UPI0018F51E86|nr:zinc finger-containing ubiquitin peptidase 1 [Scyliorhinus canicula]XP_038655546.1 zinc finger-containing ubiquitin peptidase 1 [Scyliorhinus canicula]XP_038655547.1 zinc finger-containing ubiquitin peptidase 1 [Scyliorhinus canicula]XP_038655548.1 zinc finger-containing ubiquitin peptidase 1 [Scyliorhinus canicula]
MFTCDICGQSGLSEPDMRTHILIMHEENEYNCPICNLSGISYDELMFHIETSHSEVKPVDDSRTVCSIDKEKDLDASFQTSKLVHLEHKTVPEQKEFEVDRMEEPKPEISCSASPPSCERPFKHNINRKDESKRLMPSGAVNGHVSGTVWRQTEKTLCDNNHRGSEDNGLPSSSEESVKFDAPECPFCGRLGNSGEDLDEHVKNKHSELLETPQKGCGKQRLYPCPMCKLVFGNCQILQEHVELHLAENRAEECVLADRQFAQRLQEEEEKKRKGFEAKREHDEFQKLQQQYGLDNCGGYKQQIMNNMERAVARGQLNPAEYHRRKAEVLETLAVGEDDGRTRTSGLIRALNEYYQRNGAEIRHVYLCAEADHYHASLGDKGWGCGYRNFQMLLSSLMKMEEYKCDLHGLVIPCIPKIQAMIEEAWKDGFDPQGAAYFKNKLQGTRAWIGATEIYSLLTFLRIKCQIVDFHHPTGPSDTHPRLFEWLRQFYSSGKDAGPRLQPRVVWTNKPPIYLQHHGHSRTVIGIEERNNGTLCLLVFDPGNHEMQKLLRRDMTGVSLKMIRRFIGSMKHKQYQIVAVNGLLTMEEKNARKHASAVLTAEKVP